MLSSNKLTELQFFIKKKIEIHISSISLLHVSYGLALEKSQFSFHYDLSFNQHAPCP